MELKGFIYTALVKVGVCHLKGDLKSCISVEKGCKQLEKWRNWCLVMWIFFQNNKLRKWPLGDVFSTYLVIVPAIFSSHEGTIQSILSLLKSYSRKKWLKYMQCSLIEYLNEVSTLNDIEVLMSRSRAVKWRTYSDCPARLCLYLPWVPCPCSDFRAPLWERVTLI